LLIANTDTPGPFVLPTIVGRCWYSSTFPAGGEMCGASDSSANNCYSLV